MTRYQPLFFLKRVLPDCQDLTCHHSDDDGRSCGRALEQNCHQDPEHQAHDGVLDQTQYKTFLPATIADVYVIYANILQLDLCR